jgi:hypothetical protein
LLFPVTPAGPAVLGSATSRLQCRPPHAIQAGSGPPVVRWPVRNQVIKPGVRRDDAQAHDAVAGFLRVACRRLTGRDPAAGRGGAFQLGEAADAGFDGAMARAALAGQARGGEGCVHAVLSGGVDANLYSVLKPR